jgi:hypothetical protein
MVLPVVPDAEELLVVLLRLTPEIGRAQNVIRAWLLLDKCCKSRKISSRLLHRSLAKVDIPCSSAFLPALEVSEQLKLAYKDYYALKAKHTRLREVTLLERVEALAL